MNLIRNAAFWALAGAVLSLLVQKVWDLYLARRIPRWRLALHIAREGKRGRGPSVLRNAPHPSSVFPEYFREQDSELDLAIFELSLRPDVPIMDLLYMEYLRRRLEEGSIKHAVIVPWSGWRDDHNEDAEQEIIANLDAVFGELRQRVTVVTAAMLQRHANSVFQNHFFEEVGQLGDSEFLRRASAVMGYRFRSYHDINQGHPETHQARSIVEHTVRGWLISQYVESDFLQQADAPKRIGALMWERELTKLLLLRNLNSKHPELACSLVLGATVSYRRHLRRHPIPTFTGGTITAFGDWAEQQQLLSRKPKQELRRVSAVLSEILDGDSNSVNFASWAVPNWPPAADISALKGEAHVVATQVGRIRSKYGWAESARSMERHRLD